MLYLEQCLYGYKRTRCTYYSVTSSLMATCSQCDGWFTFFINSPSERQANRQRHFIHIHGFIWPDGLLRYLNLRECLEVSWFLLVVGRSCGGCLEPSVLEGSLEGSGPSATITSEGSCRFFASTQLFMWASPPSLHRFIAMMTCSSWISSCTGQIDWL